MSKIHWYRQPMCKKTDAVTTSNMNALGTRSVAQKHAHKAVSRKRELFCEGTMQAVRKTSLNCHCVNTFASSMMRICDSSQESLIVLTAGGLSLSGRTRTTTMDPWKGSTNQKFHSYKSLWKGEGHFSKIVSSASQQQKSSYKILRAHFLVWDQANSDASTRDDHEKFRLNQNEWLIFFLHEAVNCQSYFSEPELWRYQSWAALISHFWPWPKSGSASKRTHQGSGLKVGSPVLASLPLTTFVCETTSPLWGCGSTPVWDCLYLHLAGAYPIVRATAHQCDTMRREKRPAPLPASHYR